MVVIRVSELTRAVATPAIQCPVSEGCARVMVPRCKVSDCRQPRNRDRETRQVPLTVAQLPIVTAPPAGCTRSSGDDGAGMILSNRRHTRLAEPGLNGSGAVSANPIAEALCSPAPHRITCPMSACAVRSGCDGYHTGESANARSAEDLNWSAGW